MEAVGWNRRPSDYETDARRRSGRLQTDRADSADAVLRVEVSDDGTGGADFARGTGLAGLKDRVKALGGRMLLHSPHGAGTTLRTEMPLTAANRGAAST